ncbi:MAG: redoxin domain-containing protein, partial [Firmicutes bacterium]|nr:redoxin domain-containing protein [Bacillota bacterium]
EMDDQKIGSNPGNPQDSGGESEGEGLNEERDPHGPAPGDGGLPSWKRWAIIGAVAAALLAVLLVSRVRTGEDWVEKEGSYPPGVGSDAPDFSLQILDGRRVKLSDYQGRVVAINFWATWCPPCREEMPGMQKVYERNKDKGFVILALDLKEPDKLVRDFRNELGLTFPILMDRQGIVLNRYGVSAIPTTFFIDRKGQIRKAVGSFMPEEEWEEIATTYLLENK